MAVTLLMGAKVEIKNDKVAQIEQCLRRLAKIELYVGIPGTSIREDGTSNAYLAYIHEFGYAPKNIPPRPFLELAIQQMRDQGIKRMKIAGQKALEGKWEQVVTQFESLGLEISARAKDIISEGTWLEALKPSTIARRKGPPPYMPLLDTGQLQAAITYKLIQ